MIKNAKTAVVFPGQGSMASGMRDLVEHRRPDLLELVTRVVGEDPFGRVGDGTRFDQPAIYCASMAGFESLGRPEPSFFAGHSLGEVGALVASGAVTETDGVAIVAERGRLMQAAGAGAGGGMVAVRASLVEAEPLARRIGLELANENAPDQVVLTGPDDALDAAIAEARKLGLRTKRLAVAGAFHSRAMAAAVEPFRAFLEEVKFARPEIPVLSCVTAEPFDDPRSRLAQALVSPVRWLEVMRRLKVLGVRRFVEPGPGRVLTGLVRRSLDGVEAEAADAPPEAARA